MKHAKIRFQKYHGTGNDFIIIDNTNDELESFFFQRHVIFNLCKRHYGVGADGLIVVEKSLDNDFYMRYFNSDGNESTMCGNGGRCVALFAIKNQLTPTNKHKLVFKAVDGIHKAELIKDDIRLEMNDITKIEHIKNRDYFLNTGSPHYVRFVTYAEMSNFVDIARKIRRNWNAEEGGTNVNYAYIDGDVIRIRTFERGVEDVTLSCGTGAVAVAVCSRLGSDTKTNIVKILTEGSDNLTVRFTHISNSKFTNISIEGAATHVFTGEININN